MSVFQYPDKEAFQPCSRTLVQQEIEVKEEETYYFQNPPKPKCEEKSKLEVNISSVVPVCIRFYWVSYPFKLSFSVYLWTVEVSFEKRID